MDEKYEVFIESMGEKPAISNLTVDGLLEFLRGFLSLSGAVDLCIRNAKKEDQNE